MRAGEKLKMLGVGSSGLFVMASVRTKVEKNGWTSWLHSGSSSVGLVLIHEILGHDDYVEAVAVDLAREGLWVSTVDLYRGKYASSLQEGYALRSSLKPEDVISSIETSSNLLTDRIGKGARVGSMGFCMGGGFALLGACKLRLAFCVDYYGMVENVDDVQDIAGPILVILGSEDERVTPWAYQKLLPAAAKYKKRLELQLYPNARHAFHRPNWEGHNTKAAKDAWTQTMRFLSELK